jgi:hypothetical protein
MRRILAVLLLVGLRVGIAGADDAPVDFRTVRPENDPRLAKLKDAQPQKIGILSYYPNKGGGYTFVRNDRVEFYALPYLPTTYKFEYFVRVVVETAGEKPTVRQLAVQTPDIDLIGTTRMPFGGQTLFRSKMRDTASGDLLRVDTPLAKWTRDKPTEKFRLAIMDVDTETRLKLKSVVPVLEHAEHAQ